MSAKKIFAGILAALMVASMAGCASSGGDTSSADNTSSAASKETSGEASENEVEPIVLEPSSDPNLIYGVPRVEDWTGDVTHLEYMYINTGFSADPFGTDPVTEEIIRKTGIILDFLACEGEGETVANAMLAAGDYPELIHLEPNYVLHNYISAGALMPLDEIAPEYGYPYLVGTYISDDIVSARSSEDGHLYVMPNWIGSAYAGAPSAFNIRADVYEAMGKPEIKTMDDMFNFLVQVKEAKYTNPDGTVIEYPFFDESQKNIGYMHDIINHWGVVTTNWRYVAEDGTVKFSLRTPEALPALQWMNKVYNAGLWDPEAFTMDSTAKEEAFSQGRYATIFCYTYLTRTPNANLTAMWGDDGKDYRYIPIDAPVAVEGVRPNSGTYELTGGSVNAITKNCHDMEAALRFFNYVYSPEGNISLWYGTENETYDFVNGEPVLRQEIYDGLMEDWNGYVKKTGICAFMFTMNGKYNWENTQEDEFNRESRALANQYAVNTSILAHMLIDPLSDAGITWASIESNMGAEVAAIVREPDAAKVEPMLEELLARWDAQGLADLEAEWTRQYNTRIANQEQK